MEQKLGKYIEPFLKGKKISKRDFENLFGSFDEEMMDIVIDFINKKNIKIVSDHEVIGQVFYNDKKKIASTNEELCVMYQRGNKLALDALIQKNKRLVYSRVMKYVNVYKHDLSEEDLFQEGCMGLITAVNKFDNNLGFKLTTYAINWIDQSILRSIADKGFTIRVPVHMFDKINKLNRIYRDVDILGLSYNEIRIEVMEKMGVASEELDEMLMIYYNIISLSSLNIPIGEDGDTQLGDMIKAYVELDTFDIVAADLLKTDLEKILDTLTPREEKILKLRFGLEGGREHTLEEIGKIFDVTRERIRQIEAKALRKLRHPSRSKKLRGYLYED